MDKIIANSSTVEPSTSKKRARKIMDKNCFGIREAIKYFGVNPSKQQLVALSEVPFSGKTLKECKNTHILVAVFPLSILEIRGKVKVFDTQHLFCEQDWYNKQAFARNKGKVSWQLIRKMPVTNSTFKNWSEQQALLAKNEETPKARVMVYAIIGHYLATGRRLFKDDWVQCSDIISSDSRVRVGNFAELDLDVGDEWAGCSGGLCISLTKKSEWV